MALQIPAALQEECGTGKGSFRQPWAHVLVKGAHWMVSGPVARVRSPSPLTMTTPIHFSLRECHGPDKGRRVKKQNKSCLFLRSRSSLQVEEGKCTNTSVRHRSQTWVSQVSERKWAED